VSDDSVQAVSCGFESQAQNMAACNALMGPASSTIDPDALMGFAGADALGVATTTGGGGATPVTVDTSSANLAAAISGDTPKVVQVSGTLTGSGMIDVGSNTTIIGLGIDATLDGFGLRVDGENNVIITNLIFTDSDDDGVTIEDDAHHVWVHHNRFEPNFDGALDIRRGASYVTVAWNHFVGTDKTMLVGSNDAEFETIDSKVTYHHNWFDGSVQRNPRIRFADVHVFNNHYDGVTSYGLVSVQFADVLFEANYLDLASATNRAASTGGVAESPHKGDIVACDNAEVSGVIETRGLAFDPAQEYTYNMQDAATVPATVTANAGPQ
jgi:pectate lyase